MTPLRPVAAALAACLLVAGVAACLAAPGPPPLAEEGDTAAKTETETGTPTDTPTLRTRTQVQVGVDRLRNGLNPHLCG